MAAVWSDDMVPTGIGRTLMSCSRGLVLVIALVAGIGMAGEKT